MPLRGPRLTYYGVSNLIFSTWDRKSDFKWSKMYAPSGKGIQVSNLTNSESSVSKKLETDLFAKTQAKSTRYQRGTESHGSFQLPMIRLKQRCSTRSFTLVLG